MSLYVYALGDTDLDPTSHVGDVAMGTSLDVWSENVGRSTIGAEARNDNTGFDFKLGHARRWWSRRVLWSAKRQVCLLRINS